MAGNASPNANLPVIKKTLPCLRCAAHTDHQLVPSKAGCAWRCASCKHQMHAYTHEEMMKTVVKGLFQVPSSPKPVEVPENYRVFLKTDLHGATEKEVGRHFVLEHVRITGALPAVGKPLFSSPKGSSDAPAFMAIPYGEVVRIDTGENPEETK